MGVREAWASRIRATIRARTLASPKVGGAIAKTSGGIERASGDGAARMLSNRRGLAGEHGLVDETCAIEKDSVDGQLFAGPHDDQIADAHLRHGNLRVYGIARDTGGRRLQADQLA